MKKTHTLLEDYFKKNISYKHGDVVLDFAISQELFSSSEIDHGTQRLLRTLLFEKVTDFSKALDLGCGYGPIGIALKSMNPTAEVHMVDRDALALVYSQENAQANQVGDVAVFASLGFDAVSDTDYDLIVSNIPAKVGEPILAHMLLDARKHLRPDGRVVIVVIDAIAERVDQILRADENIEILVHRTWPGHQVYHYTFRESFNRRSTETPTRFEAGAYFRGEHALRHQGRMLSVDVAYDLPEFDALSYETELLFDLLPRVDGRPKRVLCFHPGQGYVPLMVSKKFSPTRLALVDRDWLALLTTQHNLGRHAVTSEVFHQADWLIEGEVFDLVVGVVPEKQETAVYARFLQQMAESIPADGHLVISSTSTVVARLAEMLKKLKTFLVVTREKSRGKSALLLRRR